MELLADILLFVVTIMGLSGVTLGVFVITVDTLGEAHIKSDFLAGLMWLILIAVWLVALGLWIK